MKATLKKLKKLFAFLAVMLLAVFMAGCGTYVPPQENGEENGDSQQTPGGEEGKDKPGENDQPTEEPFTVTLTLNGEAFTSQLYPNLTSLAAIWTNIDDSKDVVSAKFSEEGKASAQLDGDYRVSLSAQLDGYFYNPNKYIADNDSRAVNVELHALSVIPNDSKKLTDTSTGKSVILYRLGNNYGYYRVKLDTAADTFYFVINANMQGIYSFRSYCDMYANRVNPILYKYNGSEFYFNSAAVGAVVNDGSDECSSYTKNFYYDGITYNVGQSGGAVYLLGIRAERKEEGPVFVDFEYRREDDFPEGTVIPVVSEWNFDEHEIATPTGTFQFYENIYGKVFDDRGVTKGEDGFYYLNGELLYAALNEEVPISGPFNNPLLSLDSTNGKNYQSFYNLYVSHSVGAGYPVNDELKQFLYDVSLGNQYFFDGKGFADGLGYDSDDSSQWLFACGVYR